MKSRRTRSQERIYHLLKALNRAVSAQELYIELRQSDRAMGLATVYRSLESLRLQGSVQVRKLENGESVYSSIQQDQHHLTCIQCGESIPFPDCPVHDLEEKLQSSHHFKIYYHTLEFFGLCNLCQENAIP